MKTKAKNIKQPVKIQTKTKTNIAILLSSYRVDKQCYKIDDI